MNKKRYQTAKRITLIGAVVNVLLGLTKCLGGLLFDSHGLLADGIHSFSDLLTDALVLIASKYGSQDADLSHPYGHQRIETAATAVLSILLIITGLSIVWDAIHAIMTQHVIQPESPALFIAGLSIVINESLFHYTHHIGQQIKSQLVIANAWHRRSDAASSVVVVIGLIGSLLGLPILDAIAAIIVGGMIIKMGLEYGWQSLKELVDTAVDMDTLDQIHHSIQAVEGVCKVHQLRSRSMGHDIFIDVHILVHPKISVSEGHYIAQHVHHRLIQEYPKIKDVTVHVDPEDDELFSPSLGLSNRALLEHQWIRPWQTAFPEIEYAHFHYLGGHILIDLILKKTFQDWSLLNKRIQHDLDENNSRIGSVRLLTHVDTLLIKPHV